jgi:hypothetical protein
MWLRALFALWAGFPLPRFRIGQRVVIPTTNEGGTIFGFAYYAKSGEWGRSGWTYHIHFDRPLERNFNDEAEEEELKDDC